MSRSKHQTVKSVLGGKSVAEIRRMSDEIDSDLVELRRKSALKQEAARERSGAKLQQQIDRKT